LPFMTPRSLAGVRSRRATNNVDALGPRPYRDEVVRTIAAAAVRTLGLEAISQLVDTGAAARARTTPISDLLHGARAVIDDGIDVTVGGRVADAHEHGSTLIMLFNSKFVKRRDRRP
jgi:hypothetical protein